MTSSISADLIPAVCGVSEFHFAKTVHFAAALSRNPLGVNSELDGRLKSFEGETSDKADDDPN